MSSLNRRDALKLLGALGAGAFFQAKRSLAESFLRQDPARPNIIILVMDTLSARHMSLYGYERPTTPNLERFAAQASVYHSHYSGGNFTTPGTATILTGRYPWSHRAINLGAPVARGIAGENLFHLLGEGRQTTAFTQNALADIFLLQFRKDIDRHFAVSSFCTERSALDVSHFFSSDPLIARYAFDDFLINSNVTSNPVPGSAYFAYLDLFYGQAHDAGETPSEDYPRGMPSAGKFYYENQTVYSGVFDMIQELETQSQPYLAYVHLLSPHAKYNARKEFVGIFPEIEVPFKKRHKLANHVNQATLNEYRMQYDEYIANVDAEFGRLFDRLAASGVLDHSYVLVTSDHGELFERGENGHNTFLLYDSVIHIPLLISTPGQTTRQDFHSRTSNIDLLPSLLAASGLEAPAGLEGRPLPGLGGSEDEARSIFAVEAKTNSAFGPLRRATTTLMKENFKLIHYGDYPRYSNVVEFYDLNDDIEEKKDLAPAAPAEMKLMEEELLDTLSAVDRPFVPAGI